MRSAVGNKTKIAAAAVAGVLALASTYTPGPSAEKVVQKAEGKRNNAYYDTGRIPTICYGSTKDVKIGQHATDAECDQMLHRDLTYAGVGVALYVTQPVTQDQYDALVSFVYNIGETQFRKSTLLRKLNAGDCYGAGYEFIRWINVNGKPVNGLRTRRDIERALFEKGCPAWTASNSGSPGPSQSSSFPPQATAHGRSRLSKISSESGRSLT